MLGGGILTTIGNATAAAVVSIKSLSCMHLNLSIHTRLANIRVVVRCVFMISGSLFVADPA